VTREIIPGRPPRRQPYRGQPEPKYVNTGWQFRNLRAEKRQRFRILIILGLLDISVLVGLIVTYDSNNNGIFVLLLILEIFLLIFTAAMESGTREINKFRPGYDIDVSTDQDHRQNEEEE
jgi:hypothetical protein